MKKIEIKAQGANALPYTELEPFQGELKSLHKDDYEKLKKQIVTLGFSEPIAIWRHKGHNYILNGHQRLRTISTMVEKEGFKCPPLPIVAVEAKDDKEAKRKVLALTSQYGKVEKQGLYEFIFDADIDAEELVADYRLPEIDMGKFLDEFVHENDDDPLAIENSEEGKSFTGEMRSSSVGIRTVQLQMGQKEYDELKKMVAAIAPKYELENMTDVVMECVRDVYSKL